MDQLIQPSTPTERFKISKIFKSIYFWAGLVLIFYVFVYDWHWIIYLESYLNLQCAPPGLPDLECWLISIPNAVLYYGSILILIYGAVYFVVYKLKINIWFKVLIFAAAVILTLGYVVYVNIQDIKQLEQMNQIIINNSSQDNFSNF